MEICLFKENILLLNISFLISGYGSVASFEHHNHIQYIHTYARAHTHMHTHACKRTCVAIEGFVLYIGGDYSCTLSVMLLVR